MFYHLKKSALPTIAAVSLLVMSAGAAQAMDKSEVEKIVHDYIKNNPQLILDSVNDYQIKMAETKKAEALANNHEQLYKDHGSPFIGNENGDVTIVEFFDYNCGYCKKGFPELQKAADQDKNIKVIFKDFPILGPSSETASKWALAAEKQNKYFEFHTALMNHKGRLDDAALEEIAKGLGLDVAKLKADTQDTAVLMQIEKNRALARELGISGTPAFIVGDELMPGMVNAESLLDAVASQRKKKDDKKAE